MLFSVIVPTCGRPELLAACLRRLESGAQLLGAGEYEVIVTDDSSVQDTADMVKAEYRWARWTAGPRRGPAANRNHGAQLARAEWLVFTDDDCLPETGWLAAFAAARALHPGDQLLEGRTRPFGQRAHPFDTCPLNETGGYLWSCNFAIARDTFSALGGFDERFPFAAMEDIDLWRRFRRHGGRHRFASDAVVLHPWRRLDVKEHARRHVVSALIYARLHPEDRALFTLRQHLRNIARYYWREFPEELRRFGWLALRCQPLRWWDLAYRGWRLWRGR